MRLQLWQYRPTPVPPAALKMPSRMEARRDVHNSPSEADSPIYMISTLCLPIRVPASLSNPLSTVLDIDIMVDSWLSQQGTHETLSPIYHLRTRSGRIWRQYDRHI